MSVQNEQLDYNEEMKECNLCGEYFYPIFFDDEFCETCVEDLYGKECDD